MKALGSLGTHYAGGVTQIATLWKVTRRDLQVFGFCDHDVDILYGGLWYSARSGFTGSQIATSAALAVDNLEVAGFLDSLALTEVDMEAGVWDGARFEIFEVCWSNTALGRNVLLTGTIGQMTRRGTMFVAELRGLSAHLQTNAGRVVAPLCDARFGDARCGFNLASVTETAVPVTAVTSRRVFAASSLAAAADYFAWGTVEFTTGLNVGLRGDVKVHGTGGAIEMQLPFPYEIALADEFTITPGCDKRLKVGAAYTGDCKAKWNNAVNFRGFPEVPLQNAISQPVSTV